MAQRPPGQFQPIGDLVRPTAISRMLGGLSSEEATELWQQSLQRAKFQRWAYLDPTPTLEARAERALDLYRAAQLTGNANLISRSKADHQRAQEAIAEATERDLAAQTRPIGCWCFGIGGRGLVVMAAGNNTRRSLQYDVIADQPSVGIDDDPPVCFEVCCPYCPEGREAQQFKDAALRAVQQGAQVAPAHGWTNSGVPTGFQHWRLETSPVSVENPDLMARLNKAEPANFLFRGLTGRGKTGLTIGLAWKWTQQYRMQLLYVFMPRLLSEIRATYDHKEGSPTEQDVVNKYATVPMLILDDVGREHITGTGWASEKIDLILYERHSTKGLVTLMTSNDTDDELMAKLGAPIYWRIDEMTKPDRWLPVLGQNWRDT